MGDFRIQLLPTAQLVEFHGPGDITLETTDALVNAANSSLMGGGGVDGAIHRGGGHSILEECRRYVAANGRLPAGQATITGGGQLRARYVIHTVGPIYRDGKSGESNLLASCYRESIRIAEEHKIASVAFPAISTGAYGYPLGEAAAIAVRTVIEALPAAKNLQLVRFVLFDIAAVKAYERAAEAAVKNRSDCKIEKLS